MILLYEMNKKKTSRINALVEETNEKQYKVKTARDNVL